MSNILHAPALLRLPREILDEILTQVDQHKDLISLALASHACSDLVVPRHSEYRIIRVRHRVPLMWAHLARRADLARNIREVHLCERHNTVASDHFPSTLINQSVDPASTLMGEETRVRNLCEALRHMEHLRVFTWSWNFSPPALPTITPRYEEAILQALCDKPSLAHVALSGRFAFRYRGLQVDGNSIGYPLWKINNLRSLSLVGDVWFKPSNIPHLKAMLKQSPSIEFLELPMEVPLLDDCTFPHLKKLKIYLQSGGSVALDKAWEPFIDKHPSIEELSWLPIGPVFLAPGSLPSLKRLMSNRHLVAALDKGPLPRNIECLDVLLMKDSSTLFNLKNVNGASLKKLRITDLWGLGSLTCVNRLAELFPDLTWLSLPNAPLSLKTWIDVLASFPALEVFRGEALWSAVNGDKDQMHLAIMELVQRCPNLRQLDHCDYYEKRRDYKRIVIIREGLYGENVRYEVQRPPSRHLFEVLEGTFH